MLTAHVPAGYAVSKLAVSMGWIPKSCASPRTVIGVGVVAALLPDLDMLYFLTIDQRQHLHHSYWTHIPLFWVTVCCGAVAACFFLRRRQMIPLVVLAGVNLLLHCFLDTIVAGILWHKPFSHRYTVFAEVPNAYPYTALNFILHWTFALEILIWLAAVTMFAWEKRTHKRRAIQIPQAPFSDPQSCQ